MAAIVEVKDVHKSYGKNEVLKGISLDVAEGEVVVMIGPSGSGKSTFLRSLNKLEEINAGQIKIWLTQRTTLIKHAKRLAWCSNTLTCFHI